MFSDISQKWLNALYSASSGVMIASSCFGLLNPALEASHDSLGRLSWAPVVVGLSLAYAFFSVFETLIEKVTDAKSHQSIAELAQSVEGVGGLRNDGDRSVKNRKRGKNSPEKKVNMKTAKNAQNDTGLAKNAQKMGSSKEHWNKRLFGRLFMMLSAITLHNFPEGLAVGIAFGAAKMC